MKQLIDKNSGIPVYRQLKERLEDAISCGQLCRGKRIPSENELSRHYGIHRNTVRNSLRQLAEEGVLHSVPGSGWFVKPPEDRMLQIGMVYFSQQPASNSHSGFFHDMHEAIAKGAAHTGCELHSIRHEELDKIEVSSIYDALVFIDHQPDTQVYRKILERLDIPVVICNRQIFGSNLPFVAIDQYYGTRDLVARLTGAGHTRIGCIASDQPLRYVSQRFRGYCDALTEAGIEFDENLCCLVKAAPDFREPIRRLFKNNPDMTALFIGGEVFHRQTFEIIAELKLRVPEDLSLVIYDHPGEEFSFATYLQQPCDKLGLHLLQMVRRLCEGDHVSGEIINSTIVNGKSIKNLKGKKL